MRTFREFMEEDRVRIFDGAMGTMIYNKGVFINASYDELNLTSPDLVADIHRAYIRAGAEIIETNTYGATRLKLSHQGLDEKLREINLSAVRIARRAADEAKREVYVAGAISPLGVRVEPYGPTSLDEARDHFPDRRIWITNEIIHNPSVNQNLREMDVQFVPVVDGVKDFSAIAAGEVVILPAFGASVQEMQLLRDRGCTQRPSWAPR